MVLSETLTAVVLWMLLLRMLNMTEESTFASILAGPAFAVALVTASLLGHCSRLVPVSGGCNMSIKQIKLFCRLHRRSMPRPH